MLRNRLSPVTWTFAALLPLIVGCNVQTSESEEEAVRRRNLFTAEGLAKVPSFTCDVKGLAKKDISAVDAGRPIRYATSVNTKKQLDVVIYIDDIERGSALLDLTSGTLYSWSGRTKSGSSLSAIFKASTRDLYVTHGGQTVSGKCD